MESDNHKIHIRAPNIGTQYKIFYRILLHVLLWHNQKYLRQTKKTRTSGRHDGHHPQHPSIYHCDIDHFGIEHHIIIFLKHEDNTTILTYFLIVVVIV